MSRGTGRTRAMLQQVLADERDVVTVVGPNRHSLRYMVQMMRDLLGFDGTFDRTRNLLIREDGRRIQFVTENLIRRDPKMYQNVYWDHACS